MPRAKYSFTPNEISTETKLGAGNRLGHALGCQYCEGLTARSCLDVIALVLGNTGAEQRLDVIEGAFSVEYDDACSGNDLQYCVNGTTASEQMIGASVDVLHSGGDHYDKLMVSTMRTERLSRLRATCDNGLLPPLSPTEIAEGNKSRALGGWSVGVAGFETVACAACEVSPERRCSAVMRAAYSLPPLDLSAAILKSATAPYADAAFLAACAAIERDGAHSFFEDDPDGSIEKTCTACSSEVACTVEIRKVLSEASLEDRLSVLEVAFIGADLCDGPHSGAAACADKLEHLLFESFDVSLKRLLSVPNSYV